MVPLNLPNIRPILFSLDWGRTPTYIQPTKNITALRLSRILQTMGIKNHQFMLSIFDPELINIDPHDKKQITPRIAEKIFAECICNPWYYYREVVRIPTTGGRAIPFEFHRGNLALIWCFYNDIDAFLTLPRQTGKTIATQAIMSHQMFFEGYNFDIAMYTKDHSLLIDNVLRLKDIRDALPAYLLQRNADGPDKDAREGISYGALQNRYLTFVNSNNERDSYKLGRGATIPVAHIDEIAYFNYIWITYPTLIAATIRASEDAAKAGKRCSNILTTTAGRPDEPAGAFAHNLVSRSATFTEKMYDCKDRADLLDMVRMNSANKDSAMIYIVFSHRQLGKDDEWLRGVIARGSSPTPDGIARDYLNMWMSGQENGPIPTHLLKKINDSTTEPKHVDIEDNYITRWYVHESQINEPSFKKKSLLIGMDSSEQIGTDYTSFVIVDPADSGVLGSLRCNDSNIIRLARRLTSLMLEFPKMVLVPECKSTGRAIVDYLIDELINHGINPWTRIYNSAIQRRDEETFSALNIHTEPATGVNRKLFGYTTTGGTGINSRNFLYKTVMMKALYLNHSRIRDANLAKEFCELTIKNGRIDHLTGGHDDLVISYLLCCFLLFFGKNLHFYGLDKNEMLTHITGTGDAIDPTIRQQQRNIKDQIDELEQSLLNCPPSELIKYSYMRKLNELRLRLDDKINTEDPISKMQMDQQTRQQSGRALGINKQSGHRLGAALF